MRRFIWAIVILLILSVIAAGIFLSTLDPNQIIPVVRDHLEKQFHAEIQYRTASLSFRRGVALELQDLVLKPKNSAAGAPPFTIQEARATLDLAPLLKRKFQIGSIDLVQPKLFLRISPEGQIEFPGFETAAFKNMPAAENSAPLLPLALLIQDIQLAEAEIQIHNAMQNPPEDLTLSHLNLKVKDIVFGRPFHFFISGALGSTEKNFSASGEMDFPRPGKDMRIRDLDLETDLNLLDTGAIWTYFSAPQEWPFQTNPSGTLKVRADKIAWNKSGLTALTLDLGLSEAEAALKTLREPLKNIELKIHATEDVLEFPVAQFEMSGGLVSSTGRVTGWQKIPVYDFQLKLSDFPLSSVQSQPPGQPALEGQVSFDFRAQSEGLDSDTFLSHLTGQGRLDWTEGRLANLNILREILSKISIIPGLVERLNRDLSPESKVKINQTDTIFQPLQSDFTVQTGTWIFPNATLATDAFQLSGTFQSSSQGVLDASTMFRLDPDFTRILVRSINELSALTTSQNELEIPLKITGKIPNLNFFPDLGYIGSKLAAAKASDLLNQFLNPKPAVNTPARDSAAPDASIAEPASAPPPSSLKKVKLGQLLASVLTEPAPARNADPYESSDPASPQPASRTSAPQTSSGSASVFDQLLQAALAPRTETSDGSSAS